MEHRAWGRGPDAPVGLRLWKGREALAASGVEKLLIKAGKDEVRRYFLVDQNGGGEVDRIEAAERMCRHQPIDRKVKTPRDLYAIKAPPVFPK